MATKKPDQKTKGKQAKPRRRIRKVETVRQQTESANNATPKPRRIKKSLKTASKPITGAVNVGKKEYYLPIPDNKFGRFLNKRRRIFPRYFSESFKELKLVTWPDRKKTFQLTVAVFIFAISFGVMVSVVDYGLDKLFKQILIK